MANLILSEPYVRDQSIINRNVDFDLLRPIIFMIQDTKLKPMLGSDLYNEILSQTVPTAPGVFGNLTANNKILVDNYILPMLHWYLVSESAITLHVRHMNQGIREKTAENSTAVSMDDLRLIERRYASIAQSYADDMRRYIIGSNLYPAYTTNGTYDKTLPSRTGFRSPFYLPDHNYPHKNDEGDFRYKSWQDY